MNDNTNNENTIKVEKKWHEHPLFRLTINSIAMALSGIALGWMIGMSTTPIIRDVIISVLTVFTTIMGLIGGFSASSTVKIGESTSTFNTPEQELEKAQNATTKQSQNDVQNTKKSDSKPRILDYIENVNLLPIGLFMICMAYGASRGLYMKNNHTFNTDYRKMANSFGIADSTFNKNYNTILFERGIGIFLTEQNTVTLKNNLENDSSKVIIKKEGHKVYIVEKTKTGDGLNSKPTSGRECDVASTYSADVLKDWLLRKVSVKADSIRISQIPIKNEVELKNELQKICSRK